VSESACTSTGRGATYTRGVSGMPSGPVEQALARAGVRFAYLFGSRASGESRVESDADVAIMGERSLDLLERARLAARLAEALGVPDVDLVMLNEAGLELRGRVVQDGKLIYSRDEPARVGFEVRTRSEYLDYLPTLRALERSYLERIAQDGL
jgi:predicted nucleotidyltransferase